MSALALELIQKAKETRATRLDLGNCGLTELPDELFELTWLEEVILSDSWSEYSFEKKEWEFFNSKNIGKANNIKSINPNIKIQRGLKKLIANGQKGLSDLSPLKDLTQLQQLYVQNTQVSDLTPLKDLTQLQQLYVQNTQVSDLTPLKDLTQLLHLRCNDCPITIPPLKTCDKGMQAIRKYWQEYDKLRNELNLSHEVCVWMLKEVEF